MDNLLPLAQDRPKNKYGWVIQLITWIMRLFVGGLFLFSGFTKSIDVWGTIYKFNEYFNALGYEVWDGLTVVGVFALCLAEFLTGLFLLLGCFRLAAPIIAFIVMGVMLPLSLWLAVNNPIADCGCFGDAIKISNWDTFYKNIILFIGSVWLLIFNRKCLALIHPYLQWIGLLGAGVYMLAIAWLGYISQPLIDFRPYKVGTELIDRAADDDGSDETDYMRFVYEKDGIEKEFTINDIPDEDKGWKFVKRIYLDADTVSAMKTAPRNDTVTNSKDLRLFTADGMEDVTVEVVGKGNQLILMIPSIKEISPAKTWKINSFYEWCLAHDIDMFAVVGGNPLEVKNWKDVSIAQYPVYTADDTSIKEVVRGNPGVVYLEDGKIKWKRNMKSIQIDDFQNNKIDFNPMDFAPEDNDLLIKLTWILLLVLVALIFLSMSSRLLKTLFLWGRRNRKRRIMPAEWENPKVIFMAYPSRETDWKDILDDARKQFDSIIEMMLKAQEKIILICDKSEDNPLFEKIEKAGGTVIRDIEINDTWTRDYGLITVYQRKKLYEIDFGFNGWGLKFAADKDNLVNHNMKDLGYRNKDCYINDRDFILEGGSIDTDGRGTILTTTRCLCSLNRNGGKSKEKIDMVLQRSLGAKKVLWLDYGHLVGDDTDSHIDTLARIAPDNTILYVAPPADKEDEHYEDLAKMEEQLLSFKPLHGKRFKFISLPFPNAVYDPEGHRLPATYANYLVTGNNVFIPTYGQPENDEKAKAAIQQAFPKHTVYTVDCLTLLRQHGSLHCSTMQLYYDVWKKN